jgi:GH25 family lysozyme M1 (1,4-beta-N-acetylmuramidase)
VSSFLPTKTTLLKHAGRALAAGVWLAALANVAATAQDADDAGLRPSILRRAWLKEDVGQAPRGLGAPSYKLTKEERDKFKGNFGINVSHYDFDINTDRAECKTQEGYLKKKCSCSMDWQGLVDQGLYYAYAKATDGESVDLSFQKFWTELEPLHEDRTIYRGAYHFLRPGVSAEKQAAAFLKAVGAVNGEKPLQLPPVLDVEWASKRMAVGSDAYDNCPRNRRTQSGDVAICDMWYTKQPAEIVAMAKKWIEIVEAATGRPVAIYTNAGAWWDEVLGETGKDLAKSQPFWLSRYTQNGPKYMKAWTSKGGSPKWGMPPLPNSIEYPQEAYEKGHFWQFSEEARVPNRVYTCNGTRVSKPMELNFIPAKGSVFRKAFGIE